MLTTSRSGIEFSLASSTANIISSSVAFEETCDIFFSQVSAKALRKLVVLMTKLLINSKLFWTGRLFTFCRSSDISPHNRMKLFTACKVEVHNTTS